MKKIILAVSSFIIIGCWGTDQGKGKFYEYTIRNESGKKISIKSYYADSPSIEPILINLDIGEELTKTYQDILPPSPYDFGYFFGNNNNPRDSLKVIYNNSKVSYYYFVEGTSQNEKSPFNLSGTNVTFVFTQQDYENAEPCNGNCD